MDDRGAFEMTEDIPDTCPDCGKPLAKVYGNGWDYDFIFCSCGFEKVLETSTRFDYSE